MKSVKYPDLSIVIPSYDAEDTIAKSLTSLLKQETNKILEIIVVDSGKDSTREIIRQNYPEVRCSSSDEI